MMSISDAMKRVAASYAWHRALGNQVVPGQHCHVIRDPTHPDVWSSNHASGVTAESDPQIDAVFEELDAHLGHCAHRLVSTDCFTPEKFVAELAMRDYRELAPTLQMFLPGELAPTATAAVQLRPVTTEADWETLFALVRADHEEGARTNRVALPEAVSRGIVEGFRKKAGPSTMYLAEQGGEPCAYGAAIVCPNGLGMIEDLYTVPASRGRGIASTLIQTGVFMLRQCGCDAIFLGAHISERPKYLYRKLGFLPLLLTREFVLEQ
jgi:GNAT superfamily N-acetyltransferase